MECVNLLIVGAGWHGLAMAKTYVEATMNIAQAARQEDVTDVNLVIVDAAQSIGGTWACERLYPGLKTNNSAGSYEFSDYPMDQKKYTLKPGQHIPGPTVHQYLSDFADHYELTPHIRLRTSVDSATLQPDSSWLVKYSTYDRVVNADDHIREIRRTGQLTARKLVLATGLTSEVYVPQFPGQDTFRGNLFHSKHLKDQDDVLSTSRCVVVIGGNKSAWDVCYRAAQFGAQVHMVMRPSGGGPSWVWRPIRVGSLFQTSLSRMSLTRLFTWFDPYPFGPVGKIARWFLHRTLFGRMICWLFWAFLDRYVCTVNRYATKDNVSLMRPWTSTFWMGNSLSIHNYETDWFQLVKEGRIIPHIADVEFLDEKNIHLSDGSTIEAHILVACTGWKSIPTIKFHPRRLQQELTLAIGAGGSKRGDFQEDDRESVQTAPFMNPQVTHELENAKEKIIQARKEILELCPELTSKPIRKLPVEASSSYGQEKPDSVSLGLYRYMVPPFQTFLENRNIAFIGAHMSIHAVMLAQVQALWITAFFQDKIGSLEIKDVAYETLIHSQYERIRRPQEAGGSGERFPDLVFDSLPYVDMLLEDLGINTRRKNSWFEDLFQSYTLSDYRGLVKEWLGRPIGAVRKGNDYM
ncbi:hypothetical protein BJ170DRAFT_690147 [Xylariales sp. AK1849]|nr:hypothetical protein BJ170DRAFT_690147 [Xylariales sp. AK1849]